MRKVPFVKGELYHVYNRGVEKRNLFEDSLDFFRFLKSIIEFNKPSVVGGIYRAELPINQLRHEMSQLVDIIAFCILPNHYHFILRPRVDGGVEKFMQRFGNGYTKYFNARHKRSGALFQGVFKSIHVDTNEYLLRLAVYVNQNYLVHKLRHEMSQFVYSSYNQYAGIKDMMVEKYKINIDPEIILSQFRNTEDFIEFCDKTIPLIHESKKQQKIVEFGL